MLGKAGIRPEYTTLSSQPLLEPSDLLLKLKVHRLQEELILLPGSGQNRVSFSPSVLGYGAMASMKEESVVWGQAAREAGETLRREGSIKTRES